MKYVQPELRPGPSGEPPWQYGAPDWPQRLAAISRTALVRAADPAASAAVAAGLAEGAPLLFMPSAVEETAWFQNAAGYYLHLFGAAVNGERLHVVFVNTTVSFDIVGADAAVVRERLGPTLRPEWLEPLPAATPLIGFTATPPGAIRVHFKTLNNRNKAMDALRSVGTLLSDDKTSFFGGYYPKFAREAQLALTDWIELRAYRRLPRPAAAGVEATLVVDAAGFRGPRADWPAITLAPRIAFDDASRAQKAAGLARIAADPALARPARVVLAWDTETWGPGTAIDYGADPASRLFMICATLHFAHAVEPLAQVALVLGDCEPDDQWHTVTCATQAQLLQAFADLYAAWAPDVMMGFNDGGYDWPYVSTKLTQEGLWPEFRQKTRALEAPRAGGAALTPQNYLDIVETSIKISAEATHVTRMYVGSGTVHADMCPELRKLFAKSPKWSLKYFLELHRLAGKADMSYARMNAIYELPAGPARAAAMREVAHYCVIDARSVQALQVARMVISDRAEIGAVAFCSLNDCFRRANGHKVRNLIAMAGWGRFQLCPFAFVDRGEVAKYPGALVLEPVRAGYDAPITGLDFASLYPSLIMAYELSPDRLIIDPAAAAAAEAAGLKLYRAEFPYGDDVIVAWFVRSRGPADRGLYAIVLESLFAMRAELKAELKQIERELEELEAAEASADAAASAEAIAARHERIEFLQYRKLVIDSKQRAAKVFMNTFYGEAGNARSPLFLLPIAGAVTSAGQQNLRFVKRVVEDSQYRVVYGDTDSLYILAPRERYPALLEALHAHVWADSADNAREFAEYLAGLVKAAMRDMSALRDLVNSRLAADNGTRYLSMAYEEVLCPSVFVGRKKYFGIPHMNIPNFAALLDFSRRLFAAYTAPPAAPPGDASAGLFIRGIDIIKQGQSQLSVTIGRRLIWELLAELVRDPRDARRGRGPLEIAERILVDATNRPDQWDFASFVQSAAYKPDKKNVAVLRFVERERVLHAEELRENAARRVQGLPEQPLLFVPPDPGARFEFVLVASQQHHDELGRRIQERKGEQMMNAAAARARGIQPSIAVYLDKYVVGLVARLIISEFTPTQPAAGVDLDTEMIRAAERHVRGIVARLSGADPAEINRVGREIRARVKAASSRLDAALGALAETRRLLASSDLAGEVHRAATERAQMPAAMLAANTDRVLRRLRAYPPLLRQAIAGAYAPARTFADIQAGRAGQPPIARPLGAVRELRRVFLLRRLLAREAEFAALGRRLHARVVASTDDAPLEIPPEDRALLEELRDIEHGLTRLAVADATFAALGPRLTEIV